MFKSINSLIIGTTKTKDGFAISDWKLDLSLQSHLEKITGIPPNKWVRSEQVHGTKIGILGKGNSYFFEECDGVVTNRKNVLLLVKHADCFPIFLFDPVNQVIGLVHSGWKGTVGEIVLQAIDQMVTHFGCKMDNIQVGIGPGARTCCYRFDQVSEEQKTSKWSEFVLKKDNQWHIDLAGFIKQGLSERGIKEENIEDSGVCTICDKQYFSWTRQKRNGEQLKCGVSYIGIR